MQKFHHKCAALLLAVGLLFPCTAALAQMPEESSMVVGLSSVDSGSPPAPDSGSDSDPAITYTAPWHEDEPFCTTTRADWTLDMLPKPETGWLFPVESVGDWNKIRKFSFEWSQSDYNAGLASGAERFIITGRYAPANAEDQALWDKDLLRVDEAAVPKMEVRITNAAALPFRVELGRDEAADGYYPIFAFPTPHGASKVLFEASDDGLRWFTCVANYRDTDFMEQASVYSMHYAIYTEDGEPFFFDAHKKSYYRVTVYGSAYDANSCGAQSTFTLDAVPGETAPPGSDLDDTGGNRGGGTQGETDRPGKTEEEKPKETPVAQSSTPPAAPIVPTPPAAPESRPDTPAAPTAVATSSVPHEDQTASSAPSEPQAQETLAPVGEEPLAAEPQPPPDKGHAGAVAATTTAILVAGAGGTYLFKIRRKP